MAAAVGPQDACAIGTKFVAGIGGRIVYASSDWFWEAYWKEGGRNVSRRFSENAYGEGIAERKAREARLAAEEQLPNLRRSSQKGFARRA